MTMISKMTKMRCRNGHFYSSTCRLCLEHDIERARQRVEDLRDRVEAQWARWCQAVERQRQAQEHVLVLQEKLKALP